VGEYAALVAGGVLSLADALRERGFRATYRSWLLRAPDSSRT